MERLSFGQWLSRHRKARGLTQQQLAERINCATITIRKIEADQRHPSVQIAEKLSEILNTAPQEHDAFLNYARGYGQKYPSIVNLAPYRSSSVSGFDLPFTLKIRVEPAFHRSPARNRFSDKNAFPSKLIGLPEANYPGTDFEITEGITFEIRDDYLLVLSVPIVISSELAHTILEALDLDQVAGNSSSGPLKITSVDQNFLLAVEGDHAYRAGEANLT